MIKKIISGGQTGADIGGLLCAESRTLETGGWMPNGWRTEEGPCPHYESRFGMKEHSSKSYVPRTYANVRDSNGTVKFASILDSPGERMTSKAINQYKRPFFTVDLNKPFNPDLMVKWVEFHKIEVLNVAGNRESKSPGICQYVQNYLNEVLNKL